MFKKENKDTEAKEKRKKREWLWEGSRLHLKYLKRKKTTQQKGIQVTKREKTITDKLLQRETKLQN